VPRPDLPDCSSCGTIAVAFYNQTCAAFAAEQQARDPLYKNRLRLTRAG
jgi:hypothetical protein